MATKAPAPVEQFSAESLESIAYGVVSDVETQEPNDRNRLGYHIWVWLKDRTGTLKEAIETSGSRTRLGYAEIAGIVSKRLQEKGIKIS